MKPDNTFCYISTWILETGEVNPLFLVEEEKKRGLSLYPLDLALPHVVCGFI